MVWKLLWLPFQRQINYMFLVMHHNSAVNGQTDELKQFRVERLFLWCFFVCALHCWLRPIKSKYSSSVPAIMETGRRRHLITTSSYVRLMEYGVLVHRVVKAIRAKSFPQTQRLKSSPFLPNCRAQDLRRISAGRSSGSKNCHLHTVFDRPRQILTTPREHVPFRKI